MGLIEQKFMFLFEPCCPRKFSIKRIKKKSNIKIQLNNHNLEFQEVLVSLSEQCAFIISIYKIIEILIFIEMARVQLIMKNYLLKSTSKG